MTTSTARAGFPWLIIASGCVIAALTFGPRSAIGFFQLPMLADTGWDRTTFGLAMALQNLFWGLGQPVFGAIADRYGTWRVLALSALLYAGGLYMMAVADAPIWLHIGGGVLVGLGVAAGSFGIILAAFARNVDADSRSFAFGLGTAAGSAGMFIFAPITQGLIDAVGWSDTLVYFAVAMLIVPVLAVSLRGNAQSGTQSANEIDQTARQALREALGYGDYLLLTAGFFVCGFQVAFVAAHFPAYVSDIGVAARYAVIGVALIGFLNIIGSLAAGVIGQRHSKPMFLVVLYLCRSVAIALFLILPQTGTSVILFSVALGFLWLSTVPPTNALVAVMFGTRHLGMLGGIVFLSHQIGSFLGVWMGGYLYDVFGSYNPVWWIGVLLGLFAAIVHWPIREQAVPRAAAAPAA
ncbi:MFS transporter [Hoeflea poritis]|uniref:MFS transporter n=1 Tax=Hoeflea poritis TaxID=2993659 RepID=A0ABT4VQK5_9HYPH|nr:MFS transporter [Hoeflea poritis]MDA4846894.1 MFS transporter [Hoeflea poritis]